MKTYTFIYGNSDIYGKINAEVSQEEEDLMIQVIKKHFDNLEDDSDLAALRKRIFNQIAEHESITEDDILWIHFPYDLVERVMYGK